MPIYSGYGEKGPDASLPGFDITSFWARSGLLGLTRDAGSPPTQPLAGSGDHATAISLFSGIVTGLYRRERTGKGSYVTTSLLATGVWSSGIAIQGALCDAKFFPPHDRLNPTNATFNVYQSSDDHWFLIVTTPDHWRSLATSIGRPDLLTDARFADPAKQAVNAAAACRNSRPTVSKPTVGALARSLRNGAHPLRHRANAHRSDQRPAASRKRHHRAS